MFVTGITGENLIKQSKMSRCVQIYYIVLLFNLWPQNLSPKFKDKCYISCCVLVIIFLKSGTKKKPGGYNSTWFIIQFLQGNWAWIPTLKKPLHTNWKETTRQRLREIQNGFFTFRQRLSLWPNRPDARVKTTGCMKIVSVWVRMRKDHFSPKLKDTEHIIFDW